MEQYLMDALVQVKRMGNLLNEVQDLTRQMAEAMDRNDQESVRMLVGMRQEPIERLEQADQALRDQIISCADPLQGRRLADLLNGVVEPAGEDETLLGGQMAANQRRLEQIKQLDKVLNQRMAREKSAYQ